MKSKLPPLLIVLAIFVSSIEATEVRIGPVAIVEWPNVVGNRPDPVEYRSEKRLSAGLLVEVGLGRRTALLFAPSVVDRGGRGSIAGVDGVTTDLELRYIELPLLLRRGFGSGAVRPYVAAGPSFAWLDSATLRTLADGGFEEVDLTSDVSRFDLSAVVAIGLNADVGPARLFVEGQFTQGTSNLDASGVSTSVNQGLAIRSGVTFRLSR